MKNHINFGSSLPADPFSEAHRQSLVPVLGTLQLLSCVGCFSALQGEVRVEKHTRVFRVFRHKRQNEAPRSFVVFKTGVQGQSRRWRTQADTTYCILRQLFPQCGCFSTVHCLPFALKRILCLRCSSSLLSGSSHRQRLKFTDFSSGIT